MIIAIDGPAAAGKGTLARRLAAHFDYAYLDSGALYRAVGAKALDQNVDLSDVEKLVFLASGLIGEDMAHPHLRTPAVSEAASRVAALTPVRVALKDFPRNFADSPPGEKGGAVLDGRDIGTVICPYATYKLFITANRNVRAERRWLELREKDPTVIYDRVFNDLVVRDERDETREDSPLKPATDAVVIDTSLLSADEVFEQALSLMVSS